MKVYKTFKIEYFDKPLYKIQGGIEWNKSAKFYQFISTRSRDIAGSQKALNTHTYTHIRIIFHDIILDIFHCWKYILKKNLIFETGFWHHYKASFMRKNNKHLCTEVRNEINKHLSCNFSISTLNFEMEISGFCSFRNVFETLINFLLLGCLSRKVYSWFRWLILCKTLTLLH